MNNQIRDPRVNEIPFNNRCVFYTKMYRQSGNPPVNTDQKITPDVVWKFCDNDRAEKGDDCGYISIWVSHSTFAVAGSNAHIRT